MEMVRSDRLWAKFLEANGYRLDKCVGQGSFGDVYAVTSIENDQQWAVKRLVARRNIQEDSYVMGEINALASIQHPMVVSLHEVLFTPRLACLVMDLAPDGNLEMFVLNGKQMKVNTSSTRNPYCECEYNVKPDRRKLRNGDNTRAIITRPECVLLQTTIRTTINAEAKRGSFISPHPTGEDRNNCACYTSSPLKPAFLISTFTQVTSAVSFCHSMDLAHRDINPSNVLIFNKNLVKLADFGLCFRACRESNAQKSIGSEFKCTDYLGNNHYLAPEVRRCEPFLALPADVWSLGCLLYFMLQANHPPIGNSNLTERIDMSNVLSQVTEDSLRDKCRQTLFEVCRSTVSERPKARDVLTLWNT
ncbi:SNF-related serine/threonine-protein kinase [Elysia marginata]|uniref:SNF-related serine/threonine-protein kinase n=1 Tax=Elysia marginata TaxID=1093978 RepID=A0AAV4JEN2_9GAST|nr:SNF-related serine/threonine-protein kinase [Elysia marginata]